MYETPILIELGSAQETILGADSMGSDIDWYMIIHDAEFQGDIAIES